MSHDIFYFTPEDAHVKHRTDAPVVAVKGFERGFYPIYTQASVETLNHGRTKEVLEAALIGSMFGWHVPGARAAVVELEKAERQIAIDAVRMKP